jgi:hypothetical protein
MDTLSHWSLLRFHLHRCFVQALRKRLDARQSHDPSRKVMIHRGKWEAIGELVPLLQASVNEQKRFDQCLGCLGRHVEYVFVSSMLRG